MLGFTTGEVKGVVAKKINQHLINVFVPTTPNPTSGFMLVVPVKSVIRLKMNIEEGMKLVISGGIIIPKLKRKRKSTR